MLEENYLNTKLQNFMINWNIIDRKEYCKYLKSEIQPHISIINGVLTTRSGAHGYSYGNYYLFTRTSNIYYAKWCELDENYLLTWQKLNLENFPFQNISDIINILKSDTTLEFCKIKREFKEGKLILCHRWGENYGRFFQLFAYNVDLIDEDEFPNLEQKFGRFRENNVYSVGTIAVVPSTPVDYNNPFEILLNVVQDPFHHTSQLITYL